MGMGEAQSMSVGMMVMGRGASVCCGHPALVLAFIVGCGPVRGEEVDLEREPPDPCFEEEFDIDDVDNPDVCPSPCVKYWDGRDCGETPLGCFGPSSSCTSDADCHTWQSCEFVEVSPCAPYRPCHLCSAPKQLCMPALPG
jgi:hypothetical protein